MFCLQACLCTMCSTVAGQKRASLHGIWITNTCELPHGCWSWNPGLLFCASLRPNFQFKNYWGLCVVCLWNSRENPVLVRSVLPLYTSPKTQTVRLASKHICTCALNIWKCAHMHTCTHTLHTRKRRKTQCFHGIDAMKAHLPSKCWKDLQHCLHAYDFKSTILWFLISSEFNCLFK